MIDTDKLPQDTRVQDVPVGGASDGALPRVAIPTVVAGIVTTREVPTLKNGSYGGVQATAANPFTIGAEPMRRAIHLSVAPNASTTAYLIIASSREQVASGAGYPLPPGGRVTLKTADALYIAAIGADLTWGFITELDQG